MSLATTHTNVPNKDPYCCAPTGCVVEIYNYSVATMERDVTAWLSSVGITTRVTSRLRSCDEQAALFRAGKSSARPTTSQHEFGYAFDLVPVSGYQKYGATFAETVAYLVAVARALGYDGIVEKDHAHIQWFLSANWSRFISIRDVGLSIPIPSSSPKLPKRQYAASISLL